jgi:hypothetical protein
MDAKLVRKKLNFSSAGLAAPAAPDAPAAPLLAEPLTPPEPVPALPPLAAPALLGAPLLLVPAAGAPAMLGAAPPLPAFAPSAGPGDESLHESALATSDPTITHWNRISIARSR